MKEQKYTPLYKTGDVHRSVGGHWATGIGGFAHVARMFFYNQWPLALAISIVAALTLGGKVGTVQVNPVYYYPFHEISMADFALYVLGFFLVFLLLMLWKGEVWRRIADTVQSGRPTHKEFLLNGLKCLQWALLSFLVFGLPIALTAVLAFRFSWWLGVLPLGLALYAWPVCFLTTGAYLWDDENFRHSLSFGLKNGTRYWGRLFLYLMCTYGAFLLPCGLVCLPGGILKLVVYDNQTLRAMGEVSDMPLWVSWLEYLFIGLGVFALLFLLVGVRMCSHSMYQTIKALEQKREQIQKDRQTFMEEQQRLGKTVAVK